MSRASDRARWPERAVAVSLPHATPSVREARRRVLLGLHRLDADAALIDDAVLVASELVTNALRHGRPLAGGHIEISWEVTPDGNAVRLSVRDGGSESSRPTVGPPPDAAALGGRGLGIVAAVARRWGFDSDDAATLVWAVLRAGDAPSTVDRHLNRAPRAQPRPRWDDHGGSRWVGARAPRHGDPERLEGADSARGGPAHAGPARAGPIG